MKIYVNTDTQYHTRIEYMDGREHIVVPVIMMREGVHCGSHGPLLHLAEDLGKFPGSWDGIPVTVGHPESNGGNVSANSPEILARYAVGRIFNTHMDGDKLKAEAWIDINKITAISPEALSHIQNRSPLDVSVGVFSEEEEIEGVHNNEHYQAIARNHRPDHLALLPGERGACSWSDGCGIRANKSNLKTNANEDMKEEQIQALKDLIREGHSVAINVNQQGYAELVRKAQRKLDAMDNDQAVYFLEELYDDYLVYRVSRREERNEEFYSQTYVMDNAGDVSFNGERTRVRKEVNYVQMNAKMERTKPVSNTTEKKPCCEEKVKALIANAATRFTEDDRAWLLAQDADALAKLEPIEPEVNAQEKEAEALQVDMEVYVKKADLKEIADYTALMTPELKEQVELGLKLHEDKRAEMIQTIQDNSEEGIWEEEELKGMSTNMLEKLSKSVNTPADYTGMGAGADLETNREGGIEPLLPVDNKY